MQENKQWKDIHAYILLKRSAANRTVFNNSARPILESEYKYIEIILFSN